MTVKELDLKRFQKEIMDDFESNYFRGYNLKEMCQNIFKVYNKYQWKDSRSQPTFMHLTVILGASVLNCSTIYPKGNCIQVNTKHPATELQFLSILQLDFQNQKYQKSFASWSAV